MLADEEGNIRRSLVDHLTIRRGIKWYITSTIVFSKVGEDGGIITTEGHFRTKVGNISI